ncbi:MAG: PQQ-dependent sugar dehydrogenase [Candidatus Moranbacteria bacterium]|nr:PQQ-dependent sugar dehydrogenase [Candidatus Moranbacteria bacterium]
MKKTIIFLAILILIALLGFYLFSLNQKGSIKSILNQTPSLSPKVEPEGLPEVQQNRKAQKQPKNSENSSEQSTVQVIAENLNIPWEIAFLPDKTLLITQRSGELLRITQNQSSKIPIQGVEHVGEGGLLGLALHPDFESNQWIYLYLTTKKTSGLVNRVERYQFDPENNSLNNKKIIIDDIPGASYHDGGRIAFSPNNYLFITTGDATREDLAQDKNSLAGKILRLDQNGKIPEGNPFENEVYSFGHRNPQGLAWDSRGRLWASEHGPSGLASGQDEINLIEKGQNYGWPIIKGDQTAQGMKAPVIQSGQETTWAPAALEIINDKIYFAGLRGSAIYTTQIKKNQLNNLKTFIKDKYGRLRIIKQGPDGFLYLATSNRDGRGSINQGDDKLIKIKPEFFE